MKTIATGLMVFSLLLLMAGLFTACKKKKNIITYAGTEGAFSLVGYGEPSPSFIGGVNFYCFLNIPPFNFDTGQIDNLLVFKLANGELGFIYKDIDNQRYFIAKGRSKSILNSSKDFSQLGEKLNTKGDFSFMVLDHKVELKNIGSVLFSWTSGGIRFYGFKQVADGIESIYNYDYFDRADNSNTGFVRFAKWKKGLAEWPTVESINPGRTIINEN